jgi:hypothetical protein
MQHEQRVGSAAPSGRGEARPPRRRPGCHRDHGRRRSSTRSARERPARTGRGHPLLGAEFRRDARVLSRRTRRLHGRPAPQRPIQRLPGLLPADRRAARGPADLLLPARPRRPAHRLHGRPGHERSVGDLQRTHRREPASGETQRAARSPGRLVARVLPLHARWLARRVLAGVGGARRIVSTAPRRTAANPR